MTVVTIMCSVTIADDDTSCSVSRPVRDDAHQLPDDGLDGVGRVFVRRYLFAGPDARGAPGAGLWWVEVRRREGGTDVRAART